jgi:hypothetical protein
MPFCKRSEVRSCTSSSLYLSRPLCEALRALAASIVAVLSSSSNLAAAALSAGPGQRTPCHTRCLLAVLTMNNTQGDRHIGNVKVQHILGRSYSHEKKPFKQICINITNNSPVCNCVSLPKCNRLTTASGGPYGKVNIRQRRQAFEATIGLN